MKYGNINPRRMGKILVDNGWSLERHKGGSHAIYRKGNEMISLPVVTLKPVIAQRLIKQYSLVV